jgi:hypothetical protein
MLELMVALALTSLLSLVAYTSLHLSLKAMAGSQTAAENLQELRVGETILARSLSSAVKGSLDDPIYFEGGASEMKFFTLLPLEAYNLGGVYHWRLLVGEDKSGRLVLTVEQTKNVNWRRDPQGVEVRQIIMGDLTSVRFAYGLGDREFATWDAKRTGSPPDWVRVYLTPKGRQPQVWMIPIHVSDYKGTASGS